MGREESGGNEGGRAGGDLQAAPATEGVHAYDVGLMLVPGARLAVYCRGIVHVCLCQMYVICRLDPAPAAACLAS
jgi:hypothetical protein